MAKKKELKDQSVDELKAQVHDLDREIFNLRNELATSRKLEKPHMIRAKRKDKARILTMLTTKEGTSKMAHFKKTKKQKEAV